MEPGHCLLLYHSIHDVMRAERALKQAGLWCDLIPTPRQLSSDCGMALEFECAAAEALLKVLGGRVPRRASTLTVEK